MFPFHPFPALKRITVSLWKMDTTISCIAATLRDVWTQGHFTHWLVLRMMTDMESIKDGFGHQGHIFSSFNYRWFNDPPAFANDHNFAATSQLIFSYSARDPPWRFCDFDAAF